MTHIKNLAFCGIRRLNSFKTSTDAGFGEWYQGKKEYYFGKVNIFIGENGGGKSTVIDLIDSIRNPINLVRLPRENQKNNLLSAFSFSFSDRSIFIGQSVPNEIKTSPRSSNIKSGATSGLDIQHVDIMYLQEGNGSFPFRKNISKIDLGEEAEAEIREVLSNVSVKINYWSQPTSVEVSALCRILNRAAPHLSGILSLASTSLDRPEHLVAGLDYKKRNPFSPHDDKRIAVWLSDDGGQSNHVHVSSLPAGWRRLASIVNWLEYCEHGSICLIEEPETHLHPTLQRHLAHEIDCYVRERNLQIFIATHSTVFQQMNIWKNNSRIFAAIADQLVEYSDSLGMLDRLGIKASDISQSNGVIWVEGASDRLYIKHWLELWCKKIGVIPPLENVDYAFCFYGGSALSHFSTREIKGFVEMLKINKNIAIIMDRDLDFEVDADGLFICRNPKSAKSRVMNELFGRSEAVVWITEKYTIENYLPDTFFKENFSIDARGIPSTTKQKVGIARRYIRKFNKFETCTSSLQLERRLEQLFKAIRAWNHELGGLIDSSCRFAKSSLIGSGG
jgi:hypothetical protein